MTIMSHDVTPILLEFSNGGVMVLEGLFLLWALRYLWLEYRRRNLSTKDWFKLPPSMSFIVAVIVFDFSVWLRAVAIWSWRKFYGAAAFPDWQIVLLLVAGVIGVVGALCKIRAVTKPDYGDEPWLICIAILIVFIIISVLVDDRLWLS